MKRNILNTIFAIVLVAMFSGCDDFLQLEPSTSLSTDVAISNVSDAQAALYGVYDAMQQSGYYGRDFYVMQEAASDNCWLNPANSNRFLGAFNYNYIATSGDVDGFWTDTYETIDRVNNIITKLTPLTVATSEQTAKNQILGECYFIRALGHFDLVRSFAMPYTYGKYAADNVSLAPGANGAGGHLGVPIMLESKISEPARNTVADVYTQVIEDLGNAISLMAANSSSATTASGYAAKALLARVYLYMEDYVNAATTADDVILNGGFSLTQTPTTLFSQPDPSSEAIFEVLANSTDNNATNAIGYMYYVGGYGDYRPTEDLLNAYPSDDKRLGWYYYDSGKDAIFTNKLDGRNSSKRGQEVNTPVLRLSEMYLIAAEAYSYSNEGLAQSRLKDLINTRSASEAANITQTGQALKDRIILERRLELCFEGSRLFDLIRTRKGVVRGADCNATECTVNYPDYRFAYPIPQDEMNVNNSMVQNEGYY